jgi:hypothetical protein
MANVWDTGEIPKDLDERICPTFKKGDMLNCANYRGLTLVDTS